MGKSKIKGSYSTQEAALLSGHKTTMIDYLCREGILRPSLSGKKPKRGTPRLYSFGDIIILKAIYQLLDSGISVSKLKKSLNTLSRIYKDVKPGDALLKKYFVTDGNQIYFKNKKEILVDLTSEGQLAFAYVLDLDQINKDLKQKIVCLSRNQHIYAA